MTNQYIADPTPAYTHHEMDFYLTMYKNGQIDIGTFCRYTDDLLLKALGIRTWEPGILARHVAVVRDFAKIVWEMEGLTWDDGNEIHLVKGISRFLPTRFTDPVKVNINHIPKKGTLDYTTHLMNLYLNQYNEGKDWEIEEALGHFIDSAGTYLFDYLLNGSFSPVMLGKHVAIVRDTLRAVYDREGIAYDDEVDPGLKNVISEILHSQWES